MADTPIKERDPIAGLTSILELYNGKTSTRTSSGTTTTTTDKSNLTQEQLDNQINSAMAPLAQASHGSGLSTYSDTNLALGRAQVSADILAKNAGSTRTTVTSGGTDKTSSGGLKGNLGTLALTQIGAPILKKIGVKTGFTDAVGKASDSLADSIATPISNFFSPAIDSGSVNLFAGDSANYLADTVGSTVLADTAASSASSEAGSSVLDSLGSSISEGAASVWDKISSWFAEGGMVNKAPGYASGGFVDRNIDRSFLDSAAAVDAVTSANGEIAPASQTIGDSANAMLVSAMKGGGGSSGSSQNSGAYSGQRDYAGPGTYRDPAKPGLAEAGLSNLGISALGALGPLGAVAGALASKATGTPSLQSLAMNTISEALLTSISQNSAGGGNSNRSTAAAGGFDRNNTAGNSSEGTGGTGTGASAGDGTGNGGSATAAEGGHITGPGTSTSDSIAAQLSDGEYVIDAKTVAALGPEFFQAIQAKFNPQAIQSQRAKGRI